MIKARLLPGIMILAFAYFFISECMYSQDRPLTNYEAMKKTVAVIEDKIISDIPDKTAKINIIIDGDSNVWVFKSSFFEKLNKSGIQYFEMQGVNNNLLKAFLESKIRYSSAKDDEKFIREIAVTCSIDFGEKKISKVYNENYCDTLLISDMQFINNEKIKISSNSIGDGNVLDTLLKPLVILSSSGVLVYLLFTVRSK